MKLRLGFVSNSSSSSYVILTSKETYDKALKKLSKVGKLAIEEHFKPTNVKKFDKDLIQMEAYISTEDFQVEGLDINREEDNSKYYEIIENVLDDIRTFVSSIRKDKDSFVAELDQ